MILYSHLAGAGVGVFAIVAGTLGLRAFRPGNPMPKLIATWVACYLAGLFILPWSGFHLGLWAYTAAWAFLFMGYFFVLAGLYKSLSVRILIDLLQQEGREHPFAAILEEYIHQDSFPERIRVLREMRWVDDREGTLHVTPKGARVGTIVGGMQRLFGIAQGG